MVYTDEGKMACRLCGEEERAHALHGLFQCEVCLHIMPSKKSLAEHTWRHGGGRAKAFACKLCDAKYNSRQSFSHHMRAHTRPLSIPCGLCDRVFDRPQSHAAHIASQHIRCVLFRCEQCDMDFYASSKYSAHKATHDTARPYPCPMCPVRMKRAQDVRPHVRRVHLKMKRPPPPPSRGADCPHCGLHYVRAESLGRHIRRFHSGPTPFTPIVYACPAPEEASWTDP
jgi:KRAB domain-containing zinc finger protein